MAIDTAAAIALFSDGFTNIATIDPEGQYQKMEMKLLCQDGTYISCDVSYTAPAGSYIMPADVDTICKGVYNDIITNNKIPIRKKTDGLPTPDIANYRVTYYNNIASNITGVVAFLYAGRSIVQV